MNTTSLEQAVLHLPKQDRAHLVHLLLDSLDEPSEVQVQSLWLQESQRRATEIDQGKVQLVTAEELEKQVQTLFK
ncbi:addiction module protein [Polaromonas sp.]|uniref:addiction module protein n=1 Tax=Polaromonas sp. TaxID=1869339 RepID=UPI0035699715